MPLNSSAYSTYILTSMFYIFLVNVLPVNRMPYHMSLSQTRGLIIVGVKHWSAFYCLHEHIINTGACADTVGRNEHSQPTTS